MECGNLGGHGANKEPSSGTIMPLLLNTIILEILARFLLM